MEVAHLAIGAAVVVDEGGRAEPELGAVLAAAVHDGEVVLARLQQLRLLLGRQLGDAPHQQVDLLVFVPFPRRAEFGTFLSLHRVAVAGLQAEAGRPVKHAQVPEELLDTIHGQKKHVINHRLAISRSSQGVSRAV